MPLTGTLPDGHWTRQTDDQETIEERTIVKEKIVKGMCSLISHFVIDMKFRIEIRKESSESYVKACRKDRRNLN